MKTLVRTLILSLLFTSVPLLGFGESRGHNSGGHRAHRENSYGRPGQGSRPNKQHNISRPWHSKPHHNARPSRPQPPKHHHNERPPRRPAYHPVHVPPPPRYSPVYNTLSQMILNTIGAGQMIDLWQISNDAYMLKYRIGNRYYTRYLYPGSGRYGSRSQISINWTPTNFWSLIPAININLNL